MTQRGILIFITTLLFFACSNKDKLNNSYFISKSTTQFSKEIDTNDNYYKNAKVWEQNLQLASLEDGLNGFEMRLWYNPEIFFHKKLIIVRFFDDNWEAKAYTIKTNGAVENRHAAIDSVVDLSPKSGWNNFRINLSKLQVKQLPNHSYVIGDQLMDDGITYFAETANQGSYRFTWFSNPQSNVENNESAQQWQQVVNLFNQEFDVSKLK